MAEFRITKNVQVGNTLTDIGSITIPTVSVNPGEPYWKRVSRRGTGFTQKFGENPDIDSASGEDIWDAGGSYSYQTSAQSLELVSSSANDAAAGTGAQSVEVFTLDDTWTASQQTVVPTGVSAVALTGTHMRAYRMYVTDVGSLGFNDGTLTLRVASAGATQAEIQANLGQTLMALYTIPASQVGYITDVWMTTTKKTSAAVECWLYTRVDGESWRVRWKSTLNSTGTSYTFHPFRFPIEVAEKTDIRLYAETDTNNTGVAGGFNLETEAA